MTACIHTEMLEDAIREGLTYEQFEERICQVTASAINEMLASWPCDVCGVGMRQGFEGLPPDCQWCAVYERFRRLAKTCSED